MSRLAHLHLAHRAAAFFQVLHPLELLSEVIVLVAYLIDAMSVPVIAAAAASGAMGALLRRAFVYAACWAALAAWLAAGAPGLLPLVIRMGY